ncbi:glycosyl transferase [Agromyces rhizosphaerae]|uniref:Glycosyl transferase n=1 Tax=Agromyces rhizosphaerae TaxID=88374 RepID=A0A9W6CSM3_9MICO|nr:glycosyltransferase family 2 protein [Agromyces rhizosphaerae]GLI26089.1 glycosyl transferase [Agromyces rhizosphaerae]
MSSADAAAPVVAVVTVAYHSEDALEGFFRTLPGALDGVPAEVVVVDNASADRDRSAERARRAGATFVGLDENLGYGAGADAGVAALRSRPDYLVVVNPDVEFTDGAIRSLLDAADSVLEGAAFGPRIVDEHGAVYPSARRFPRVGTGVGHALLGRIAPGNPWTRAYRAEDDHGAARRETDWLSGACLLLRRSAYDEVGGFDHDYFMYFEDVDLGQRLADAGWHSIYVPDATVMHFGARSTSLVAGRMDRAHHDSAYRYLSRVYPRWYHAPLRLALRAGLGARSLARSRQDGNG